MDEKIHSVKVKFSREETEESETIKCSYDSISITHNSHVFEVALMNNDIVVYDDDANYDMHIIKSEKELFLNVGILFEYWQLFL